MPSASDTTFQAIRTLLTDRGISFREVTHEPTFTSQESAAARGEPMYVGAKALLVKTDDQFRLFVLPADEKLDSAAVKREFGVKKIRFATREELFELCGLAPGSVPPFGAPILPFELFGDATIGEREDKVAFNAGSLTNSIIMTATDWKAAARPRLFRLGKSEAAGDATP